MNLQQKIDALAEKDRMYEFGCGMYHGKYLHKAEVNKALQEFREQIDNYPILSLKNCVTPEARNAVQEFQTIVLALIGEKQ